MVAGVCRIQLIEKIDTRVGPSEQAVTTGEEVPAMAVNALGRGSRALYLPPQFFANKPVDLLICEGLQGEGLNDASVGRALRWMSAESGD
jgi:Domain of unknown function (DUF4277)